MDARTINVRQTAVYGRWFSRLRDPRAKAKIAVRIDRLQTGNPGDSKPVGEGVMELRVDYGPGYRVYYVWRDQTLVLLLCGGDKTTQEADIKRAKALAQQPDEAQ